MDAGTCTGGNYILHSARQKKGGAVLQDRGADRRIVNDDISRLILDACIELRLVILAAVCDSGVCRSQLQIYYAVGDSAESQRLAYIQCGIVVEGANTKFFCIIKTKPWRDGPSGI